MLAEIYRPLYLNAAPILYVGRRTAELIKYASNAFLATKITFINEMADLCESIGADVHEVARGMGLDNRIGAKFLHAGPGFGGSCFPKDTTALLKTAHDHGAQSAHRGDCRPRSTNSASARWRARWSRHSTARSRGKTIAVLGLTFKPNTDDTRDSPAIPLITALQDMGARVRSLRSGRHGAGAAAVARHDVLPDAYHAAEGADALVIATEWEQFRALDLRRLRRIMKQATMVDLRNVYRADEWRRSSSVTSASAAWA